MLHVPGAEGVSAAQAGRCSGAVLKKRGCVLFIASICEKCDLLKKNLVCCTSRHFACANALHASLFWLRGNQSSKRGR